MSPRSCPATAATPCPATRLKYLERAVLVAVDLHVAVAVAVKRREHDAEGSSPVAEEHEQAVPETLLGEDGPALVDWNRQEPSVSMEDTHAPQGTGHEYAESHNCQQGTALCKRTFHFCTLYFVKSVCTIRPLLALCIPYLCTLFVWPCMHVRLFVWSFCCINQNFPLAPIKSILKLI